MPKIRFFGAGTFVFVLLCSTLILSTFWGYGSSFAQDMVTIREGRQIEVEMVDDARSGAINLGDTVTFRISKDVKSNSVLAMPKGTLGFMTIKDLKTNGRFGKAGFVEYGRSWIELDGLKIPVEIQGSTTVEGDSKLTKGLLYLVVGVLFVKGEAGGYAPGDEFTIKVMRRIQVPEVVIEAPPESN